MTLLPVPVSTPVASAAAAAEALLAAFLAGRKATTLRAYKQDLAAFAAFRGTATPAEAARLLLSGGPGHANGLVLAFRARMLEDGLSPATVNRRLAALRSMVKLGRTLGMVNWSLDVEGVRSEPYRDTRGPGRDGVRKLLQALDGRQDAKAVRDRAVVRLLYDLGLRRGEVVGLDRGDFDPEGPALLVLGKGRREKQRLTLPGPTAAAVRAWLLVRGGPADPDAPLFVSLSRAWPGHRLTGDAVHDVIVGLGRAAGLVARPHGLRHAAITELLNLTNGNLAEVQGFSRHRSVQTLLRYDDNRQDRGGKLAARLAEGY